MTMRNRINKKEFKAHKMSTSSFASAHSGSGKGVGSVCRRIYNVGSSMSVDEYRLMIDHNSSSIFSERGVFTNSPVEALR